MGAEPNSFFAEARALLERLEGQTDAIEGASRVCAHRVGGGGQTARTDGGSRICADAIGGGGLVHCFGTGHSRIPVEELFPRYGSYPGFNPIVELSMTFHTQVVGSNGQRQAMFIERTPGLAEEILKSYAFGP